MKHLVGRVRTQLQRVREEVVVSLVALVSLAVHGHFRLPGLAEADAARFARLAFLWHNHGKMSFDDAGYQIHTSTLYLQLEKVLLDHVPMHALPDWVNWIGVGFGTAYSVVLYVLFRRLTLRPLAVIATLVHALTPAFWVANLYGMPTVPGMFFFAIALILFIDASRRERPGLVLYGQLLGALVCMTLAMSIKSDLALCGGAFLAVAFARSRQRFLFVCYASAVVVGGTLGSLAYAHAIVLPSSAEATATGGLLSFLKSWNETFQVSFDALLLDSNNTTIVRCVGGLLFGVIVLAVLYGLVSGGRLRKQTWAALIWALPPILAWGVRLGNSARHNLPAFPPLILLSVIFLFEILKYDLRRTAVLVSALMCASYWSNTAGDIGPRPQSNLLGLTETMAKYTATEHRKAREIAETTDQKRVLLGGFADAHAEFEILSHAVHPVIERGDTWVITDGDRTTIIDYNAKGINAARALASKYRKRGFEVYSRSFRL